MKKRIHVMKLAVIVGASFLGGVVTSGMFVVPGAQAGQGSSKSDIQKWEYAAAGQGAHTGLEGGRSAYIATIIYYRTTGLQLEKVEGQSESDAESKAIAKLGEEGWEMVDGGSGTRFKRPAR